jgi:toxin CptA
MAAVVFFVFQAELGSVLDTWLIGIVAWIAAWAGIMLVHYYKFARGDIDAEVLFDPVGSKRLPDINWATMASFAIGVGATWLFLYGLTPALQGYAARAMGGVDLSWLAGGLSAAGAYAVLGGTVHHRFAAGSARASGAPAAPLVAPGASDSLLAGTTLQVEQ